MAAFCRQTIIIVVGVKRFYEYNNTTRTNITIIQLPKGYYGDYGVCFSAGSSGVLLEGGAQKTPMKIKEYDD